MTSTKLPDELRAFVLEYVDSIAHLEALLLLFRNEDATLALSAVAEQLYVDEQMASAVLARLGEIGLAVQRDAGYQYRPDFELDQLVHMLARQYARHLISITSLIHAK